jgi:uroporphyrin-III C-methyltransferase
MSKIMLNFSKSNTILVYVGKRFNNHSYSQDEINNLLLDYSRRYSNVVRLKGGDSFVFGRGAEEMSFLEDFGVEVEVVPGISSAIAVPELQGIPLTKRNISESFMVITGVNSKGEIPDDLIHGAKSNCTLVVLMGLRNIEKIMNVVSKYRSAYTPFAVIQNGSLLNERILINSIGSYKESVKQLDCQFPGVLIIGDVVSEHPQFLSEEIHRVLERFS